MLDALLLSMGLALDCLAVAAAYGAARRDAAQALRMAVVFGAFHPVMAGIGYAAGAAAGRWFESWDHWLAFGLLVLVGIHMIVGAVRIHDEPEPVAVDLHTLFVLAFATSIDAVAAGVTLPLLDAPPAIALGLLGVVTFAMTLLGARAGVAIGSRFGQILEVVGGLAIVAIGVRVLAQHL